jgi:hypothetical protein
VNQHNQGFKIGIFSYSTEVNQFSDGTVPSLGLMRPNIAPQFAFNLTNNGSKQTYQESNQEKLALNPAVFNPEPSDRLLMRPNIAPQFFDDLQVNYLITYCRVFLIRFIPRWSEMTFFWENFNFVHLREKNQNLF